MAIMDHLKTSSLAQVDLLCINQDAIIPEGDKPESFTESGYTETSAALRKVKAMGLNVALAATDTSTQALQTASALDIPLYNYDGQDRLCRNQPLGRMALLGCGAQGVQAAKDAGFVAATADAHPRLQAAATTILDNPAGPKAVTEMVDLWLTVRGHGQSSRISQITGHGTYIIAEIGQNHQGDPAIARELIRTAKLCGAHAVKSQKRDVRSLLTPEEYNRPYTSPHAFGATYGAHREALELSPETYADLLAYSEAIGIEFFASPWDIPSARVLKEIGCPLFKIPSAAVTNIPLLKEIASYRRPVILSTGMSTLQEIDDAVALLSSCELYILQCTSAYPVDFKDINLNAMPLLAKRYSRPVGLSGHHRGVAVDLAAVALGARILERHFTLDRTQKGTDHAASLEPPGLSRLVRDVGAVRAALGGAIKEVLACELPTRAKLRGAVQLCERVAEAS